MYKYFLIFYIYLLSPFLPHGKSLHLPAHLYYYLVVFLLASKTPAIIQPLPSHKADKT